MIRTTEALNNLEMDAVVRDSRGTTYNKTEKGWRDGDGNYRSSELLYLPVVLLNPQHD